MGHAVSEFNRARVQPGQFVRARWRSALHLRSPRFFFLKRGWHERWTSSLWDFSKMHQYFMGFQ